MPCPLLWLPVARSPSPQLITLMTNLFPGMSAEDIVRSQVGQLAKIQLERMLESGQQPSSLEGVVG